MTQYRRQISEHQQVPVTYLLLVLSAASIVTCLATSSPPIRKSRLVPSEFNTQYHLIIKKEIFKAQILRSLNMTTEPEPPTRKPPQQPVSIILNRLPVPRNHTHKHPSMPDAIVWSEPVGRKKMMADQLLFRVNNQKKKSAVINRVSLLLRLRSKQPSKRKGRKARPKKAAKGKLPDLKGGEFQNDDQKRAGRRSRRKKKPSKSRRKKSRRVKVLVQALNENSGKFKRVAVQRFTVDKKFRWIKLPIPASLVAHATQSLNQTLVLRVRCKRCFKSKVSIDSALPRKKYKPRQKTATTSNPILNRYRPYLVIHTADAPLSAEAPPPQRSARHVDGLCPNSGPHLDLSRPCCAVPVHVTFKDLGWDHWIVHPEGFTTVLCRGVCQHRSSEGLPVSTTEQRVPPAKELTVPSYTQRLSPKVLQSRLSGGWTGSADIVDRKLDQREQRACQPQDKTSLELMYYTDQNTLVRVAVPGLVSRRCGCVVT